MLFVRLQDREVSFSQLRIEEIRVFEFYVHVTVHRDKFPHNKTNQMH
jgi:hypothetical protein